MEDRDYTAILADALDALRSVPDDEHTEEVGETLEAVIEDLSDVLQFMFRVSAGEDHVD